MLSLMLAGSAPQCTSAGIARAASYQLTAVSTFVEQPQRQIKQDRRIGRAFKRGVRVPGEVVLGERTWTRDGKPEAILSVTTDDVGTISDERTSFVVGLLRGHTARRTTNYKYDDSGRLIEETKSAFGATYRTVYQYGEGTGIRTGAVHYDGGKPSGSSEFVFDANDSIVSLTEYDRKHELLSTLSVTYDAHHHRSSEIKSNYGLGEKLESEAVRRYAYDDHGRLTEAIVETDGIQTGIRRYAYDGENSKPSAISEGTTTWKFVYDKKDRVVLESEYFAGNPRGYRRFEYDADGSLIRETSYNADDQLIDEIVHNVEYW
jgi:YD repeat-containing protein